jgi:cobalt/nickel transport protein
MLPPLLSQTILATVLNGIFILPVAAHFQEIIPSADVLPEGGDVTLDLVFTHPFEGGPIMAMKRPAEVGVLDHGTKTDLTGKLVEQPKEGAVTWQVSHNLPEPGAAIFYVKPQPYWEPAENKYIVHYAKVIVDSFASGEGWDEMIGLPVEIQPLTRPTGLWTGNIFSGVVIKAGKPVPFAEIEVEYVNDAGVKAPNDAYITQVIKADENGTFNYAMPASGWWGFAALVEGDKPMQSPDGKDVPVEEGALIWIHTNAMGK